MEVVNQSFSGEELTRQSATVLSQRLARGEVSSVEVVEAHIQRIEQVNGALNAVVVPRFKQARHEAREADAARRRDDKLGPLHGVPVTVKEMFDLAGVATTAGLTTRTSHRATRDAAVVTRLKNAGAIILGKTNVPQLGTMLETDNPVYGRTNNPWDVERSPGGSTGGEAAIIAAGGSPLGLGSDAGGSIRQPAHCCGIHGLKPTARRLPLDGHWSSPNFYETWAQPGPMARDVEDLWLGMRVFSDASQASGDLHVCPASLDDFRKVTLEGRHVAMYTELAGIRAAPAVRRAVTEAADALRSAGATVTQFSPPDIHLASSLYTAIFYADGLRAMKRQCKGSQLDWRIKQIFRVARLPTLARRPLAMAFQWAGQYTTARTLRAIRKRSLNASDYMRLINEQRGYQRRFAAGLDKAQYDAIICPPSPLPALTHGEFYANHTLMYTGLYNLLGMPAGVVAATKVRPGEESDRPPGRDQVERCCARVEADSVGLPVGVQIVSRWWREDVALAIMHLLESHFRSQDDYPLQPPV